MTHSGLATRPRPSPARAPRPGRETVPPPPRVERERLSFRRVFAWSISLSVLLHLLVLLLPRFVIQIGVPPGATSSTGADGAPAFGMEALEIIVSADAPDLPARDAEADEEPPLPTPATSRPALPTQGGRSPGDAQPGADAAPPGATARDALQPGYRDSRLYVVPREFPELDRTEHERYMEHLEARIDAVNDSIGAAAARERRTSDWTLTDRDGNRWGLSPDGLHLGGVTIPREILPLPGATGDNQTLEAERERIRMREEIQRQEGATDREEARRERTEAIRQREEANRAPDS